MFRSQCCFAILRLLLVVAASSGGSVSREADHRQPIRAVLPSSRVRLLWQEVGKSIRAKLELRLTVRAALDHEAGLPPPSEHIAVGSSAPRFREAIDARSGEEPRLFAWPERGRGKGTVA